MKTGRKWGGLLVLWLFAPLAMAAQPYVKLEQRLSAEQMQETGLSQLSAAQLARLNEVLAGEEAQRAPAVAPVAASTTTAVADDTHDTRGRDALIGWSDEPIRSRLVGTVAGWEPGTVFVLENGQQWKVLKGSMRLSKPMTAPQIRVVPGVAGRWFLEVDPDTPKARVYRID